MRLFVLQPRRHLQTRHFLVSCENLWVIMRAVFSIAYPGWHIQSRKCMGSSTWSMLRRVGRTRASWEDWWSKLNVYRKASWSNGLIMPLVAIIRTASLWSIQFLQGLPHHMHPAWLQIHLAGLHIAAEFLQTLWMASDLIVWFCQWFLCRGSQFQLNCGPQVWVIA